MISLRASRVPEGVLASETGIFVPDDEISAKGVVHLKGGQKKGDQLDETALKGPRRSSTKANGSRETSKRPAAVSKGGGSSSGKDSIREMQLAEEAAVRAKVEDRIRKARAALLTVTAMGNAGRRTERNRELVHNVLPRLAAVAFRFLKSKLLGDAAVLSLQQLSGALARPRLRAAGLAFVGALRQVAFANDSASLEASPAIAETINAMLGELMRSGRAFPPQVSAVSSFRELTVERGQCLLKAS